MANNIHARCLIERSAIFKPHPTEKNTYQVNNSELSDDECHMFFHTFPCEERLITTTLEYFFFHPDNMELNNKFKLRIATCKDISLFWCSFPKNFKDVCERAGKVFNLVISTESRMVQIQDKKKITTTLLFPVKNNLLFFNTTGKRMGFDERAEAKLTKQIDDIVFVANSLSSLKLD